MKLLWGDPNILRLPVFNRHKLKSKLCLSSILPHFPLLKFLIWIQCCFTDDNFNQDSFKVNFQDETAPKTQSSSKLYKVGDKSLVKNGEPYGKYMKSGVGSLLISIRRG